VVEQLVAAQSVPGSNPGECCFYCFCRISVVDIALFFSFQRLVFFFSNYLNHLSSALVFNYYSDPSRMSSKKETISVLQLSLSLSLFFTVVLSLPLGIGNSTHWKRLEEHARSMKSTHLRSLLADNDRCKALFLEHDGIVLDYCRQNVTSETVDMLMELAGVAGLDEKKANMASGKHLNNTEDRSVFHIALRAPRDKAFIVDGENVVPAVHSVLDRVRCYCYVLIFYFFLSFSFWYCLVLIAHR
jgi:hypothetical protein